MLVVRNSKFASLKGVLLSFVIPLMLLLMTGGKIDLADNLTLAFAIIFVFAFAIAFFAMADRRAKIIFANDGVTFPGSARKFLGWDEIRSVNVAHSKDKYGLLILRTHLSLFLKDATRLKLTFFPLDIDADSLKQHFDKVLAKREISLSSIQANTEQVNFATADANEQELKSEQQSLSKAESQALKSQPAYSEVLPQEKKQVQNSILNLTGDPFFDEIVIIGVIIGATMLILSGYASLDDHNGHVTFGMSVLYSVAAAIIAMTAWYVRGIIRGKNFSNLPEKNPEKRKTNKDRPRLTKMKKRSR